MTNTKNHQTWNSKLYDTNHDFVSKYGESLIPLLNPQSHENILDLGCGTGTLTSRIAAKCNKIVGIDASSEMVIKAQKNFPDIEFLIADGQNFSYPQQFDAVFSNAALHWMLEPEKPIQCVYEALKPGGRFVLEMGGKGNIAAIIAAINHAAIQMKLNNQARINYFPGIAEYTTLLEQVGFTVKYAQLYERPTPLSGKDGLRNWVKMFRNGTLANLAENEQEQFFTLMEEFAKPELMNNNTWVADYVRLRIVAYKTENIPL